MGSRENSLLDEIEKGALDSTVPLAETLRKCVALGGQAGSSDLRDWATRELNGYDKDTELPDWRVATAPITMGYTSLGAGYRTQRISPADLPLGAGLIISEEVRLKSGVKVLELSLNKAHNGVVSISLPGAIEYAIVLNLKSKQSGNPFDVIEVERLYWAVPAMAYEAILDRIRTSLVALVAELRLTMPADADTPSAETASNALQVVVYGNNNTLSLANAQATGQATSTVAQDPEPETEPKKRSPWWKRWEVIAGIATVAALVVALGAWLFPFS